MRKMGGDGRKAGMEKKGRDGQWRRGSGGRVGEERALSDGSERMHR